MRYAILFILIFLIGFGALHFLSKEDAPTPPELTAESVPEVDFLDSLSLENEKPSEVEDTVSYTLVDNHYNISWQHLAKVDFEERFNEDLSTMVAYPIFHPSIKKLDGQLIQLKGYVIPLEETGDETIVILSAFPFTSCFFCGGAGPETVMDIQLKKQGLRFKQDAMVTFRGKLRLNDSDLDYLNYILDDASILE